MLIDICIIFFLILLNGFFAMSEMAVVSARKARLSVKAEAGSLGARAALKLVNDPSNFLAAIQIGITLIGVLSGAYSGNAFAEPLGNYFTERFELDARVGYDIALALVVLGVTYLSLTIGELVPKQLALKHAEPIASAVAPLIALLVRLVRPLIWLLNISNRALLKLLRADKRDQSSVTEEEVKAVIMEGGHSGALEHGEREILERIMRLNDFGIRAVMTHRQDIVWLDVNETLENLLQKVEITRHSHYLLCEGSIDRPLGIVVVKDLLLQVGKGESFDLEKIMKKPMYLPDSASVIGVLDEFKQSTSSLAALVDDYGSLQGIVTLKDMLEALIGTLPEPAQREDFSGTERADGSWLLDGGLSILETEQLLSVSGLSDEGDDFHTLAGFVLAHIGHIPKAGDHFTWRNMRFEVIDMDRNRIDKVLAIKSLAA